MGNSGDRPDPAEVLERLRTGGGLALSRRHPDAPAAVLDRLGDYRILGTLADGGMGQVFLAERADGRFQRQVAIKIPHGQFVDSDARRRFLQEQRLLAEMQHRNICQLFDAGITESGQPYLVMELVAGETITGHCATRQLSMERRLALLSQVAGAVAYAHGRLVVHRDLKPSNILVTADGEPKLLDFGIAKSVAENPDETATATYLLTPKYASPEQLLGGTISVASDLFQLGLLIYETLLDEPLNDDQTLEARIRRVSGGHEVSLATARGRLPREVLAIITQCLRLDPDARYASAAALRDDIDAYLARRPVKALGTGRLYVVQKFLLRNRNSVLILTAALVAMTVSTAVQMTRLAEERDVARRQSLLADESLGILASFFSATDPEFAMGEELTASRILATGEARIDQELEDQPEIQARLYYELAATYDSLNDGEAALRNARKAVDVHEDNGLVHDEQYFWAMNVLANELADRRDHERSTELFQQAIDLGERRLGSTAHVVQTMRGNLAINLMETGHYDEAAELLQTVVESDSYDADDPPTSMIDARNNLAVLWTVTGHLEKSIDLTSATLAKAERSLGEKHPAVLHLLSNQGMALLYQGDARAALPVLRRCAALSKQVLGAGDVIAAVDDANHGLALLNVGRIEEAKIKLSNAVATLREDDSASNAYLRWQTEVSFARGLRFEGRLEEANETLLAAIDSLTEIMGPLDFDTFKARREYAELLFEREDPQAPAYWQALQSDITSTLGDEHWLASLPSSL